MHNALQYVGAFAAEVDDRHQERDQQQIGLCVLQTQLHPLAAYQADRQHRGNSQADGCKGGAESMFMVRCSWFARAALTAARPSGDRTRTATRNPPRA